MKKVMLLLFLGALIGCASAFIPSARIQSMQTGMTPEQAAAITAGNLSPSSVQSGLCAAHGTEFDEGTPVTATPASYSFKAYKRGEKIREYSLGSQHYRVYKKDYYTHQTKFSDIRKVRITRAASSVNECKLIGGTYVVSIYTGVAENHGVFIAEKNFDEFMAALMKLAPQAKLIEGAGF